MRWFIALPALLLAMHAVSAQDSAPEFDVEIIVFRHVNPDMTEQPAVAMEEPVATEVRRRRYPTLPADQLQLGGASRRLLSSAEFSPILHAGWRQPTEPNEVAAAMPVAGNRLGATVNGTVRVSLDRFLRIEVDLAMDDGSGQRFHLDQARRVRSGEVHYFDHPHFGVLAVVNRPPG